MKKTLLSRLTCLAALLPATSYADSSKANNATALNLAGSWTNATVPGSADIATWDSNFTANTLANQPQLGADTTWRGIQVTNVGGAANGTTLAAAILNTSSANTLTLGNGGINMSAATQLLVIQSKLSISANQTWNVANANTNTAPVSGFAMNEDLAFASQVNGTAVNLGTNTVTKSGAGTAVFSSGHTISNGTFNVDGGVLHFQSGSSRITTLNSNLNLVANNGGTVSFAVQSAAVNSAAPITLNTGGSLTLIPAQGNALTQSGNINVAGNTNLNVAAQPNGSNNAAATLRISGNISGAGNINLNSTVAAAFTATTGLRFSGNNSGYTGTLTMSSATGSRLLTLESANSGSAAATWVLNAGNTLRLHGVSASLGTLNGAGELTSSLAGSSIASIGAGTFSGAITNGVGTIGVTKNTSGTLALTGANTYTGTTQVDVGTLTTTPLQTGATTVNIANGAAFGVSLVTAGTTFNATTLNAGTTGASTVLLGTGALGNPTAPLINATTFTPQSGTVIKLTGTALSTASGIPLISYGTLGGSGFAGLAAVQLPARTNGSLVDNSGASRIDLNITSVEQAKWRGTVDANWDADTDGTGTNGTQNWRTTVLGSATKYLQGTGGTDTVNFDNSADGTRNVNLTTTLTPVAVNVSGTGYTFGGAGKLSGFMPLNVTGGLTVANTTANDYSGSTTIAPGGSVTLGNGVTSGAGILPGPITNDGTLVLNRPDDHNLANTVTGTGTLQKEQANTVTVTPATTSANNIALNAGKLKFSAGGSLSGTISGAGQLENSAGTLQLSGTAANTNSGLTTVSGGLLQLNKTGGVEAVGGNVVISGTGQLALLAGEQIPNTATITFNGSSADSIPTQAAQETVSSVNVNSSVPGVAGGQLIMRNNFTVTGTATVNSGILGVASGHTGRVNGVNITAAPGSDAILRIAGNSAASKLEIGSGGITASGGEIQVKFNTSNQNAELELGGNFNATGNVAITNAGYTGANLNVITLTANRTFDIATGTTTTVQADFGGAGGLTKSGNGTLSLLTTSTGGWAGNTIVSSGTLSLTGSASIPNSPSITVKSGATFDVSGVTGGFTLGATQTLGGKGSVTGSVVTSAGSQWAPGESPGTLTVNGSLDLSNAVAASASSALVYELDAPGSSDQTLLTGAGILTIGSGALEFDDFDFTALGGFDAGTYVLFDTSTSISGTLGTNLTGTIGGFTGTISLADGTNDIILTVVPEPGTALLGAAGLLMLARRRRLA